MTLIINDSDDHDEHDNNDTNDSSDYYHDTNDDYNNYNSNDRMVADAGELRSSALVAETAGPLRTGGDDVGGGRCMTDDDISALYAPVAMMSVVVAA